MRLVLDSSVLTEGDWHLSGSAARALLAGSRTGQLELIVPELVIREVVNSHLERERATIDKVNRARSALRRLQGPLSADVPHPDDYPARNDRYEDLLRSTLDHAMATVPGLPEISHSDLLDRALARKRPFDVNGQAGYRDALIWQTVLEVTESLELTVLATRNSKDFADEGSTSSLHPDLREDLTRLGVSPGSVRLCGSLDEAVRIILTPARELISMLNARLESDKEWLARVKTSVEQAAIDEAGAIEDTGVHITVETSGAPFDGDITDSRLEYLQHFSSPTFTEAYAVSETEFIVWIEVQAEALYQLEVSTGGFTRDPVNAPRDVELSGDEATAFFGGFADITLYLSAWYDLNSHDLSDVSTSSMASS